MPKPNPTPLAPRAGWSWTTERNGMGRPRMEGGHATWPPPVWRGPIARASKCGGRVLQNRVACRFTARDGRPAWLAADIPAGSSPSRRRTRILLVVLLYRRIRVWSTYEINAARVLGATVGRAHSQREGAERGDGRGGTGSERLNNILRAAIKVLIWTVHLVLGICAVPPVICFIFRCTIYIRIFGFCAVDMGCIIRNRSG